MDRRSQPGRRIEEAYPFHHEVAAQFRDLDPVGHVNNVVLSAYYEDARVAFFRQVWGKPDRSRPVEYLLVANASIDYLAEARFPGRFRIGVGVARIGGKSFQVSQAVFRDGACLGVADYTLVNACEGKATELIGERRAKLTEVLVSFAQEGTS